MALYLQDPDKFKIINFELNKLGMLKYTALSNSTNTNKESLYSDGISIQSNISSVSYINSFMFFLHNNLGSSSIYLNGIDYVPQIKATKKNDLFMINSRQITL